MEQQRKITLLIIVASLGYFVDIFDLVLFNVVKTASLTDLHLLSDQFKSAEISLFNYQMTGMMIGGLFWGILGDKIGRVSVLFGSILIYSIANILNAFVHTVEWYAVWRLVAGLGLAGELGAGITLVSETMTREKRGIGTLVIVAVGALGAVAANMVGSWLGWREAYIVGGAMGLVLLFLRAGTFESRMFKQVASTTIVRGNILLLFKNGRLFWRYIACILIGIPIWYSIGVMINLSNRYGESWGMIDKVNVGRNVMFAYIGLSVGDLLSGYLSQLFRSRKKIILAYLGALFCIMFVFHFYHNIDTYYFSWMSFAIGVASGYWALFVINAAEQFGTNIRSTVANTVPNFVRFSVVPITLSFNFLSSKMLVSFAGFITGIVCLVFAIIGLYALPETFARELDYIEE